MYNIYAYTKKNKDIIIYMCLCKKNVLMFVSRMPMVSQPNSEARPKLITVSFCQRKKTYL